MLLNRRGFLSGLIAAAVCAPAIVRPQLLMPIRSPWVPWGEADIDDMLRPDILRQDLAMVEYAKQFALAERLKFDGSLLFKTIEAGHPNGYWSFSLRRATGKFLTQDSDYVRRFYNQA